MPARHRLPALLAALLGAPLAMAAAGADLADLETKVQYAYFTEDARSLTELVRSAERPATPLERYHVAHAQYRLALLLAAADRKRAMQAASGCIDLLDGAIADQPGFAEGLALQGACYAVLAPLKGYESVLLWTLAARASGRALGLAPDNPRVVLLDSQGLHDRPAAFGGDHEQACAQAMNAARRFETPDAEAGTSGTPTWGRAEAWLAVGRCHAARDDVAGARNAFERALEIAPDFAAARHALAELGR